VDPGATSAIPVAGDGGVSFPVRIPASYVAPVYPRIASLAGLDGVVRVQARIGTSGEVLDIVSVEATPGGRGFEEAATDAIRSWRFTPAVLDGRPVEVLMPLVVEFKHRR
jgi:protein TonB